MLMHYMFIFTLRLQTFDKHIVRTVYIIPDVVAASSHSCRSATLTVLIYFGYTERERVRVFIESTLDSIFS